MKFKPKRAPKKKRMPANPYLCGGRGKHTRSNSLIVRCDDAMMLQCTTPNHELRSMPRQNCRKERQVLTFCRCGAGLIFEDLQSSTSPRISTSQLIPSLINMRAPQLATAIKTNAIKKLIILYTMFSPFLRPFVGWKSVSEKR